jgi:hypothetical protein
MGYATVETFFRPPELARQSASLPAPLYNRARLLLGRGAGHSLFVPIRTMQYIGVVERHEVVFVDSQAYAVQDGLGGRMILLAWQWPAAARRDSLTEPVACDWVVYHRGLEAVRQRLVGDFGRALEQLERRQADPAQGGAGRRKVRILALRQPGPD